MKVLDVCDVNQSSSSIRFDSSTKVPLSEHLHLLLFGQSYLTETMADLDTGVPLFIT
jgi:hypothetical protein